VFFNNIKVGGAYSYRPDLNG